MAAAQTPDAKTPTSTKAKQRSLAGAGEFDKIRRARLIAELHTTEWGKQSCFYFEMNATRPNAAQPLSRCPNIYL